jgi:acyl carrier protein phosphodiesterase
MKATRQQLETAKNAAEDAARNLRVHEVVWDAKWYASPNAFIAIKEYVSAKNRAMRKPVIDAYLDARQAYDSLKEGV